MLILFFIVFSKSLYFINREMKYIICVCNVNRFEYYRDKRLLKLLCYCRRNGGCMFINEICSYCFIYYCF